VSSPAGHPHGLVEVRLGAALAVHVAERALGRVLGSSQGYELPSGDTLEPDAAFISHARWVAGPPPVAGHFLRIVPDLAVEILSPSTARRDRGVKVDAYRENGVREYWLVDPATRTVAVIDLEGRGPRSGTVVERGTVPSLVLPGLGLEVAPLFAD
jgi:Uma2 family endonuclease